MSPRNQRKRFLAIAEQIRNGSPPINKDLLAYIAEAFERIGQGEDANSVLGLKYGRGQKKEDEISLEQRSLILHWMTCAMRPENDLDEFGNPAGGLGLTLEQAIDAVISISEGSWTNPKTKEKCTYFDVNGKLKSPFNNYTYETLSRLWRESANKHMRTLTQSGTAKNSPYPHK